MQARQAFLHLSLSLLLFALACPLLTGQDPAPSVPMVRTTPRAARLTFFAGQVQIQRTDNTAEDTPLLNLPLPEGTRIVTGDYGQAEVEFEDGSVVRLTPRSALALQALNLDAADNARTTLALLGGLAYFELRKSPAVIYKVQAGGLQAAPLENLTLRVNLDEPPASFAVLAGAAQLQSLTASQVSLPAVRSGETFRPDAQDEARYFLSSTLAPESWDQWNQSRDLEAANQADTRTAARDGFAASQGYGWSDLDASGTWYSVPGQGNVWQPSVAAGAPDDSADFDPYANGAWTWSGSGYVFASAYTWGWTPYRCGRWGFYPGFGWGWTPNVNCGQWGFGGGGGGELFIYAGGGPPRRIPIPRPVSGPGAPHPILPVHPPNRTHPPVPIRSEARIAGSVAVPLAPVGPPAQRSLIPGRSLDRDFPVDSKTHQPVLGLSSPPSSSYPSSAHPSAASTAYPSFEKRNIAPTAAESPTLTQHNSDRTSPSLFEPLAAPAPARPIAPASPRYDLPAAAPRPAPIAPPHYAPPPPPPAPRPALPPQPPPPPTPARPKS